MATIRVHTAQNVTLEYEVASLGDRIVATFFDYLVLLAWGVLWTVVIRAIADSASGPPQDINYRDPAGIITIILMIIIFAPYFFYNLVCEVFFNGQTLGKKARHIRVMRLDGTAPRLGDYLLRWLLRIVDFGFFGGLVAVITIAANGRGQRLGDLAAGTTVVLVRPRPELASPIAPGLGEMVGYQVVFPQAAQLADHDVALIRQLLYQTTRKEDFLLLNELANKVKALTGIYTDLRDDAFLRTVLRDHAHLMAGA